jgi:hypothetical protein
MENIAAPITKEEALAEYMRVEAAALAEYNRAMTAARDEHRRVRLAAQHDTRHIPTQCPANMETEND